MPRKKQGLRSYHHKSRNGCSQCKRRRVKCSMNAPACANCVRRNEVCEYPGVKCASNAWRPLQFQDGITNDPLGEPNPIFTEFSSCIDELRPWVQSNLECHSGNIAKGDSIESHISLLVNSILRRSWFSTAETALWSKALVTSAIRHPYLQHCMFSLAYLRRDLLDQPIDGMSVSAYQHQLTASTLFRQGAPVVDAENWIAIIAFHIFMLVFQFATQSTCADADFNLINTLHILRSSNAVEEQANPFFEKSPFWELIIKRPTAVSYEVDSALKTNLQALAGVISELLENDENDPDDEERAEINRQACAELREWISSCDAHPRRWNQYCSWPGRVTPEFLDLLADKDDVALLLVIHWCAVLHRSPKPSVYKWAHRAACYAIDNLSDRSRWENLLTWPLQAICEPQNDRIFEARLAKDLQLSNVLPRDAPIVSASPTDSSTWSNSERLQAAPITNGSHGASALMLFGGAIGPFDDSFITRTTGRVDPSLLASTPGMLDTTKIPATMGSFNISQDPTTLSNTTGGGNMAHFYDTSARMSFDMEVDLLPIRNGFAYCLPY